MARIFIVDDDPDVVDVCTLILESEGHEVTAAYNRADVMMEQPDDGIAMAQELRRNKFAAPILMLTSIAKATGFKIGQDEDIVPVDAFEEKPLEPRKLVSVVNTLLSK